MHKMEKQERKMHTAHEIGAVEREAMTRSAKIPKEEDAYEFEGFLVYIKKGKQVFMAPLLGIERIK